MISRALMEAYENSRSSPGLVEGYSQGLSSDGERFALSSEMSLQQAFLCSGKTTEFSLHSRYGMTFSRLTERCGEELLTWYLAGFRAKPIHRLLRGQTLFGTTISLGLIITFIGYVQRFNQPIQQIAVLWTNIQNAVAGGERIFALVDERPTIQDKVGAQEMPAIAGTVTFSNVSAGYQKDQAVLKNVSFQAEPGQTIAIVGPTGAGKTTLINLIPRFYDVSSGSVSIDGYDVRDVTAESLRQQIGIVLQDSFLFSASVMENIRFGRPEAADAEVIAAAQLARADTFIERLPQKYETVLGERGSGLSQGQRQLLSIARAALADPRILILDEATSSVDTRTERLIQKALDELLQDRTSFVIAHRLSTIRNADVVLVLRDGQIVERGRHQELLAVRGFYYDLYMSQFRREEEAAPSISGNGAGAAELSPA